MSPLDDFHAAIVAGDPKKLAVNDVVVSAGLRVGRIQAWQSWKPGEVVFVNAIQRALKSHGRDIAIASLSTIAKAFEGQILKGCGAIFDGLSTLIHEGEKAGTPIDLELMQFVLSETGLDGWREAVEHASSAQERGDATLAALRAAYAEVGAE